ncbi:hypothetical protein B7463_g9853, partial [Scytalidium lignicola]
MLRRLYGILAELYCIEWREVPSYCQSNEYITFKKRNAKAKAKIKEKPVTSPQNSEDSSALSEDKSSNTIKRKKKNTSLVAVSSVNNNSSDKDLFAIVFTADCDAPITSTNNTTKQSNWFDEDSKNALIWSVGPMKVPTNVCTITFMDFAEDICKGYKLTGFCGFVLILEGDEKGDSCKFLHAREDYKQGWQLGREWENVTMGKKNIGDTIIASADRENAREEDYNEIDDIAQANIPFACIIYKKPYKDPIVTQCGHYFCGQCVLRRYRKDPSLRNLWIWNKWCF